MTNIVKLALIKSVLVSLTTALHQILLSVPLDSNQEISEYYLFVKKTLLRYGGGKLKPLLARKCTKLS